MERAQQVHPGDFWINLELGVVFRESVPPRWVEAARYLTAALALRPDSALVLVALGDSLRLQGDSAGAIAVYRRAIELQPDLAQAHSFLGLALLEGGDVDDAVYASRRAIELQPDLAEAYANLGRVLMTRNDIEGATGAFRRAIELKSDLAQAHNGLGVILSAKGDSEGAIAAYRRAIELNPDDAVAHSNLAVVLLSKGETSAAVAAARRSIELQPELANAHNHLGMGLSVQGDNVGASFAFRRAIDLKPNVAEFHNNLGKVLLNQGDAAGSIEACRRAIELKPGYAEAHCHLGLALRANREFSSALAELERGHELGSKRRGWQLPSARWIDETRLLDYEVRFDVAYQTAHFVAAAQLYREALGAEPGLTWPPLASHRYNAACAAAVAGRGAGEDEPPLSEAMRAEWRQQALVWLRDELEVLEAMVADFRNGNNIMIQEQKNTFDHREAAPMAPVFDLESILDHWFHDPDLIGVRDEQASSKLTIEEQAEWQALWSDVAAVLNDAAFPAQPFADELDSENVESVPAQPFADELDTEQGDPAQPAPPISRE